jgi:excinuclease ABC subunit C
MANQIAHIEEKLSNLPRKPGIYIFRNTEKKVLYVGKAKILRNRVRSYFQKSRPHDPLMHIMLSKIADVEIIVTDSDIEALILEANLIKKHKPRYNIKLKDDKSFPFIRITNEDFPQVFPTRTVIRDGSHYFGPYTNVKEMRAALRTLKRLFTIRSCKYNLTAEVVAQKKVQLCLDYYIKKCKGPCQGLQSREDYAQTIEKVKKFLHGKTDEIMSELQAEMRQFADSEEFEEAAHIRDKIETLENYRHAQKMVLPDLIDRDVFAVAHEDDDACAVIFKIREGKIIGRVHYYMKHVLHKNVAYILEYFINQYYSSSDEIPLEIILPQDLEQASVIERWLSSRVQHFVKLVVPKVGDKKKLTEMCLKNARYLLEELKLQRMKARDSVPYAIQSLHRDLHLKFPPLRIECFDISNIQGTDPVASMVTFINGKPKKSEYRRFKINVKETPDDFAMMREAVHRRYKRVLAEKSQLPDLILIDGGKGQLSSALMVLHELGLQDQPVIGLAKRLEEIFFPGNPDPQTLPKFSSGLRLLQQIRDEAHRFAVTFHRQRRSKRTLQSDIDNIPGIGPKRRNQILKEFGSLSALKKTTIEAIVSRARIPRTLAERIYSHFHSDQTRLKK